jgi:TonB family protein
MINLSHYRRSLFLIVLAGACAAGRVQAQESVSGPHDLPVINNHRQAAALAVDRSAPEYPPVAKVNYIQGPVQVELTVNDKGKVARAHAVQGNAMLAASALKAVRRWIYHPLATPSGPSGFVTTVKLTFSLSYRITADSLAPKQAERDFLRQVKPPQLVQPPQDSHPGDLVHVRVLVNEEGEVVDMGASPMDREKFEAARESLRNWTFRPAHWGNLPIASYVDVDVPVGAPSLARANANTNDH